MNDFKDSSRILIVDDDAQMRHIVLAALEEEGYEFLEASSGSQGIEIAQKEHPDLILLDLMMPGMNGYEVCQRLRENPKTASIPVLMVTALGALADKVQGLESGADDYITKPFFADELRSRVTAHLRRSTRDLSANPLTSLPGNNVIEHVIRARLERRQPIAVLYIDLSNFKEYNDEYGWLKGDLVLKMLARTIAEVLVAVGGENDFVGHVGGDDFIVVTAPERAEHIAQTLIKRFDAAIPESYSEAARERRYIEVVDRKGRQVRVPLMNIAVAIVSSDRHELSHSAQIAAMAAEVKRYLKTLPGSQYAFDRRIK
jgi:diguanylate cyclase (GGDEF)-like protein